MKKKTFLFLPLLLAACSGSEVRDTLGINRSAPDEFKVVSRPPLSVPPDFELRPPVSGGDVVDKSATEQKAKSLILGTQQPASADAVNNTASAGESQLLNRAGAAQADPAIREQIQKDRAVDTETAEDQKSMLENLVGSKSEAGDSTVDPAAEAARIKANKASGKPVNEGEVPTVEPKDSSTLDKLLN